MKQTLKIQVLIYSAVYLISSFIAWDLTWLPCRVYSIAANMPNYTMVQRAGVLAYLIASAFAPVFMHLHFRHRADAGYADGYLVVTLFIYAALLTAALGVIAN